MIKMGTLSSAIAGCSDAELCRNFLLLKYYKLGICLYELNENRQMVVFSPADAVLVHEDENIFFLYNKNGNPAGEFDYKTCVRVFGKPYRKCSYLREHNLYGKTWSLLRLGVKYDPDSSEESQYKYELETDYKRSFYKNGETGKGIQILKIRSNDEEEKLVGSIEFPTIDKIHLSNDFLAVQRTKMPYSYVEFARLNTNALSDCEQELDEFLKSRKEIGISDYEFYSLSLQYDVAKAAAKIARIVKSSPQPEISNENDEKLREIQWQAEELKEKRVQNLKDFRKELQKNK